MALKSFVLILISCAHSLVYPVENSSALKSLQSKNGPEWVASELKKSRVFEVPDFEFTNDFEVHKKFSNIKGLFFNGLPFKGKQTKVFCWYGKPENLKLGEKAPAVVLVHGGGGTAFPEWVKKWTDKGYIALSVALEGQIPGEKVEIDNGKKFWPTSKTSGPRRIGFFEDVVVEKLQNQWFYHAVADVIMATSLLKSFSEVDTTNIGITGISWGGILTNVITGIDNRFAFAIPVYGCGFLQETPNYSEMLDKLTQAQQTFYLKNWEPSLYVPLQKTPTLFVNGTNDFHFTMNSFTKTFDLSPNQKYLYVEHNMKHGHAAGWTPETIYSYANYISKNGKSPIVLSFKNLSNNNVLNYEYKGEVNKVFLYYTNSTADWGRDNYVWKRTAGQHSESNKLITAILPKEAVAYFINTIDSDGIMYSSTMKMIDKK